MRFEEIVVGTLRVARVAVAREITEEFARRIEVEPRWLDELGTRAGLHLTAKVLTESLPPEWLRYRISRDHVEAVGEPGVTTDFRFRSWWDHFVATYRARWWAAPLRLYKIRYVQVPVPFFNAAEVHCDHEVTVAVRAAWTYPFASTAIPAEAGYPILQYEGHEATDQVMWKGSDPWSG